MSTTNTSNNTIFKWILFGAPVVLLAAGGIYYLSTRETTTTTQQSHRSAAQKQNKKQKTQSSTNLHSIPNLHSSLRTSAVIVSKDHYIISRNQQNLQRSSGSIREYYQSLLNQSGIKRDQLASTPRIEQSTPENDSDNIADLDEDAQKALELLRKQKKEQPKQPPASEKIVPHKPNPLNYQPPKKTEQELAQEKATQEQLKKINIRETRAQEEKRQEIEKKQKELAQKQKEEHEQIARDLERQKKKDKEEKANEYLKKVRPIYPTLATEETEQVLEASLPHLTKASVLTVFSRNITEFGMADIVAINSNMTRPSILAEKIDKLTSEIVREIKIDFEEMTVPAGDTLKILQQISVFCHSLNISPTVIQLNSIDLTGVTTETFSMLKAVKALKLSKITITSEVFRTLSTLQELNTLEIYNQCKIPALSTKIPLPSITVLSVSNINASDLLNLFKGIQFDSLVGLYMYYLTIPSFTELFPNDTLLSKLLIFNLSYAMIQKDFTVEMINRLSKASVIRIENIAKDSNSIPSAKVKLTLPNLESLYIDMDLYSDIDVSSIQCRATGDTTVQVINRGLGIKAPNSATVIPITMAITFMINKEQESLSIITTNDQYLLMDWSFLKEIEFPFRNISQIKDIYWSTDHNTSSVTHQQIFERIARSYNHLPDVIMQITHLENTKAEIAVQDALEYNKIFPGLTACIVMNARFVSSPKWTYTTKEVYDLQKAKGVRFYKQQNPDAPGESIWKYKINNQYE
ncbi:hypothetical protein NEOKW01_0028 [Nematocida sp. AWRm80]|nr:hypothetical protein NEOKW01_0028 [Nematocida sp. AWRm80]